MSQGSEAENLKTLGAPRQEEGARVSVMFVTGAENSTHALHSEKFSPDNMSVSQSSVTIKLGTLPQKESI